MDGKQAVKDILELKAKTEQAIKDAGKPALLSVAADLFEAIPEAYCVTWTQFTPYFNDGDPCVFGLSCDDGLYSKERYEEQEGDVDPYDGDLGRCEDRQKQEAFSSFCKNLYALQDVCEAVFGDGCQIKIFRDGSVEVEGYDHD